MEGKRTGKIGEESARLRECEIVDTYMQDRVRECEI